MIKLIGDSTYASSGTLIEKDKIEWEIIGGKKYAVLSAWIYHTSCYYGYMKNPSTGEEYLVYEFSIDEQGNKYRNPLFEVLDNLLKEG